MEGIAMFDLPQMLRERTQLLRRVEAIDRLIEAARAYQASASFPANPPPLAAAPKPQSTARGPSIMRLTEKSVTELIEGRNAPVPLGDIVEHLRKSDVPLPTKSTKNVVSARLSNSTKFTGRRGLGWWLADRPWPGELEILEGRPDGNGALNGQAASAPEAGEGATSPNENSTAERLLS